jgi:hypothetical protein
MAAQGALANFQPIEVEGRFMPETVWKRHEIAVLVDSGLGAAALES